MFSDDRKPDSVYLALSGTFVLIAKYEERKDYVE
jgi:hypothetical protein